MSENVPLDMCAQGRFRSLCTHTLQWAHFGQDAKFLHAENEDSDQIAWMCRLIWVFLDRMPEGTFSHIVTQILLFLHENKGCEYRIYPKYCDTLSTYHTCPKSWNSPFYYLLMCLKYCCMYGKRCRPSSDATFCGIWSGSTLIAKAYLSRKGCYGTH